MRIKSEDILCARFSVVGVAAVGAAAFGAGYFLARNQIKANNRGQNNDVGLASTNQLEFDFNAASIKQVEATTDELLERVEKTMTTIRHSIFKEPEEQENWDEVEEAKKRDGKAIYILHQDEFFGDEFGYAQTSLNYYEEDDILCDEEDVPIYNYVDLVGELEFGRGTDDKNVVYIRNETRECEYEILRNSGSYAYEILGIEYDEQLDKEIEHSATKLYRRE
jgi:hypothetical protein